MDQQQARLYFVLMSDTIDVERDSLLHELPHF
jgi:hypothetical protein